MVEHLSTRNNGLYTNEWLIGDAKNNEIAMYELGTHKTKLWRSSKNEWFGGTDGFYWGNNNAKDPRRCAWNMSPIRRAPRSTCPSSPRPRDIKWQELYREYKGKIDEQFAFLAFRTAPLVSASTMDAKVVTAEMASNLMVWAAIGKPNQREWVPSKSGRELRPKRRSLPVGLLACSAPSRTTNLRTTIAEAEQDRLSGRKAAEPKGARQDPDVDKDRSLERLDHCLHPTRDLWLSAASATYHRVLSGADPPREYAQSMLCGFTIAKSP